MCERNAYRSESIHANRPTEPGRPKGCRRVNLSSKESMVKQDEDKQGAKPVSNTTIDPTVFQTLKEAVGEDFIGELIETYLNDAPKLIAEIRRTLKEGNTEVMRRAAHSLKSNSGNFGATRVVELAKALEITAKSGALEGAPEVLNQLELEYRQAADELRRLAEN